MWEKREPMSDERDRTTGEAQSMTSMWVESLGRNMHGALDLMEAVIRDCPDLWHANLWEVPRHAIEVRNADGTLIADPAEQHAIAQWQGQLWGIAWHALEVFEANLTAYFVPWKPWAGFGGKGQDHVAALSRPWTRTEMLGYIGYCRERATYALKEFMEERAATPIGSRLYAERVMGKVSHVVEHATQVRQFLTGPFPASSPTPQSTHPRKGDGRARDPPSACLMIGDLLDG